MSLADMKNSTTIATIHAAMKIIKATEKPHACSNIAPEYVAIYRQLDIARRYFTHDQESLAVFDFAIRGKILETEFGPQQPLPDSIYRPLVETDVEAAREKALALKPQYPDENIEDIILYRLLGHYSFSGVCEIEPGDVVFDLGAFTGDSTRFFADKAGENGRVFAFEASKQTFWKLKKDLSGLSNVEPVYGAAFHQSGFIYMSGENTPVSQIITKGVRTPAIGIDDFVKDQGLRAVDFIKTDIEGAEMDALRGAKETIGKFKPKMALSIYHKPSDLWEMPQFIHEVEPGYTFYLRHYGLNTAETVLYCVPPSFSQSVTPAPEKREADFQPLTDDQIAELFDFCVLVSTKRFEAAAIKYDAFRLKSGWSHAARALRRSIRLLRAQF